MLSFRQVLSFIFYATCVGCGSGVSTDDNNNAADIPPPGIQQFVTTETVRNRSLAVCLNCHNRTIQTPDLRTAQAVKANASNIQFQVNNGRMPPPNSGYSPLSPCQKEILNKWIELGLPDSSIVPVNSLPNCPAGLTSREQLEMSQEIDPE